MLVNIGETKIELCIFLRYLLLSRYIETHIYRVREKLLKKTLHEKKSVRSFTSFSSLLTLKFRTYHDIAKMIAIEVMYYVIGGDIFHISWLLSRVSLTILTMKILASTCLKVAYVQGAEGDFVNVTKT